MSDLAIRAQHVAKRYRLGQREHYRALRDVITDSVTGVTRVFRKRGPDADNGKAHVWALKDVSFDVHQGDVVGVIGRNGAGKSTLLKVLSRITEPTSGFVDVKGRCGALLEVGTGFHPELTGRENIFLNAAILGMKRTEILRKFDEIVAFAEIERFLDTVVKRYSSGMYMRLAFAVAAHLEPDILVVDEVLAVGDTTFQKKCLGKMGEIAKGGRPVIFVSHNMSAVHRLCNRAILLSQGEVLLDGPVDEAVREYLRLGLADVGEQVWADESAGPGDHLVRLLGIRTRSESGEVCAQFDVHDSFTVEIDYAVLQSGQQICAGIEFVDAMGAGLFVTLDNYSRGAWGNQEPHPVGRFRSTCTMPGDFLAEGDVSLNITVFSPPLEPNHKPHIRQIGILRFSVNDRMDPAGSRGNFPYSMGVMAVRPLLKWTSARLPHPGTSGGS